MKLGRNGRSCRRQQQTGRLSGSWLTTYAPLGIQARRQQKMKAWSELVEDLFSTGGSKPEGEEEGLWQQDTDVTHKRCAKIYTHNYIINYTLHPRVVFRLAAHIRLQDNLHLRTPYLYKSTTYFHLLPAWSISETVLYNQCYLVS